MSGPDPILGVLVDTARARELHALGYRMQPFYASAAEQARGEAKLWRATEEPREPHTFTLDDHHEAVRRALGETK